MKSYWAIPLLVWMNLAIFNAFTGVQSLLASGNDKKYSKCFQIGVAFTVIVNFVLIYLFKGAGAAYAPAISELFLSILLVREIRRCDSENIR
ncbi:MAG: polysaccharide biosynthesis C-terminal domain-containing protein [Anaerolineaceae bacterium]|nr:polysaccharide biosynthesis C-terminal domain-containing protein [Anaerolineaceae bacterium]